MMTKIIMRMYVIIDVTVTVKSTGPFVHTA